MKYFETLPKIVQTENFSAQLMTNIMARASVIPSLLSNPLVYYEYDVQDGDTPEIVAQKYYGDSYAYWVVLYTNQMTDPQWDWPLSYNNFNSYIEEKYTNNSINAYSTVHHYEKITTQVDLATNTTTTNKLIIDEDTYNSLTETSNTYSLPTGNVFVTITKNAVSIYDYELDLNESKRSIKILNRAYLNQIQDEFKALMS